MAFGSFGSAMGPVSGFSMSTEGSSKLGGIDRDKYATESAMASSSLQSMAQMRAQKYMADKQLEAAQAQADAMNSPGRLITGMLGQIGAGFAGGFGGGLGKAAGASWFG
jgi:hypothetical protein